MKYFLLPRTTLLLLPLHWYADLKGHALYRPDVSLWLTKKFQHDIHASTPLRTTSIISSSSFF